MNLKLWILMPLLLVFWLASGAMTQAQTITPTGQFEPGPCTFDSDVAFFIDETVQCGWLTVPVNHAIPEGQTLRLMVVIFKATGVSPASDPIFLAQGGPGGSTISDFHPFFLLPLPGSLRENRDVVLFDQRGTLYTEPNLVCPELQNITAEVLSLPMDEASTLSMDAMAACRARLVDSAVNIAAYNSLENAADVEALRKALGYEAINFYGVSYGTLLGLHLLRDYPQGLRSLVLDAVVPPQINFLTRVPRNTERVYSAMFAACAHDAACHGAYPNLEPRFFALVDRLNQNPASVSLTDPETGTTATARLDGDTLINLVFQLFYLPQSSAIMPKVIEQLDNGDYGFVGGIWQELAFNRTVSDGMYFSVLCAEDNDFASEDVSLQGVRPAFAEGTDVVVSEFKAVCDLWNVPALPASIDDPVSSQVPVLLLSGQFDPITPPAFAEVAAQSLPNSYHYVLPTGSHGIAWAGNACINDIMHQFLANPRREPTATCLGAEDTIDFVTTPILTVPLIFEINTLDSQALARVLIAGLFLLGVCSIVVVWPLGFVMALFTPSREDVSRYMGLRWIGRVLVLLFVLLASTFVATLTSTIFGLSEDTNLAMLSAVPASYWPLFLIPLVLMVLSLGMATVMVLRWAYGAGPLIGRLYYTFVTLCAIGYVTTLTIGGMLTVLL